MPTDEVAEAAIVIQGAKRSRAIALRLEVQHGRWRHCNCFWLAAWISMAALIFLTRTARAAGIARRIWIL